MKGMLACQKRDMKKMSNQAAPSFYETQFPSSKVVPTWRHLAALVLTVLGFVLLQATSGSKGPLADVAEVAGFVMCGLAFVCCWQLGTLAFFVETALGIFCSSLSFTRWWLLGVVLIVVVLCQFRRWKSGRVRLSHLFVALKGIPMMVTPKGRAALGGHPVSTGGSAVTTMTPMTSMPISAAGETAPGGSRGRFEVIPAGEMKGFESIGGMEALKGELRETVGLVLRYPIEAAALKVEHGGVLLFGRPGVGKSAFGRAIAGEFHLNALLLNASNLSTEGLLGVAAQKVGEAFELAKAHLPCLVFIDELETMAGSRNAQNADKAAVGAFLTQLDAAVKLNGLVVVGATNYLDRVDEAVRRPGRFDLCVEIKLPDAKGREAILRAHLRGRACSQDIELGSFVAATEGWSGAKIEVIIKRAAMSALGRVETGGCPVILQSDLELGLQKAQEFQEPDEDDLGGDFWKPLSGGVSQAA
jgi:hypothetical protein